LKYGSPKYIRCDNGKQYIAKLFKSHVKFFQCVIRHIKYYNKQANGISERVNSTTHKIIRNFVNKDHTDWVQVVPAVAYCISTTRFRAIQSQCLFSIVCNRLPTFPYDFSSLVETKGLTDKQQNNNTFYKTDRA